jgi:hypothetical protein
MALRNERDPSFLSPVLDTFVRALPYAYRNTTSPTNTCVRLEVSGEAGRTWFVSNREEAWMLLLDSTAKAAANVVMPPDVEWRLFTKGIDRERPVL